MQTRKVKKLAKKTTPRKKIVAKPFLHKEIEEVLESVRPMLALHRGDVELVGFDPASGVVSVRLKGTCQGGPLSQLTLKAGIEEVLKGSIHGIERVEAVE